jgi:formate hydrogenlyase transcriptional activator
VSHLDLPELLRTVSACLKRVLPHDLAGIALYDSETRLLVAHALNFPHNQDFVEMGDSIPIEGTPEGLAFTSREPVLIKKLDLKEFPAEMVKRGASEGLRSGCAVPLISRDRTLGTLSVVSLKENAFTEDDAKLLRQIGDQIAIAVENGLAYREIENLKTKLNKEKLYLEEEIRSDFEEIVGDSPAMKQVLKQVGIVAPTDSTVLILGETGTGKELLARAIHDRSKRREGTFVKLNCAAIPTGLLESELFGHEKGAFTGAIATKIGRFELADGGTLFLDEVGDIPLELQSKLLRVLQEQEFERLGSTRTIKVKVRLLAATNRDLLEMVENKQFRSDLYYRLNVFPIRSPSLRDRAGDIPLLVRYFTQRISRQMEKRVERIPAETMEALCRYRWPGNVRELENLIERAVILSQGTELHVPLGELKITARESPSPVTTLQAAEREHILRALQESGWVIAGPSGAAALLGMKRSTLQSKMIKLGISRHS